MSDDLRQYFSRFETELNPRIEVREKNNLLHYDSVMRMNVETLAKHEISLFGRTLVIGAYEKGYRATWAPNCTEVEHTFGAHQPAGALLHRAYSRALNAKDFDVVTPLGNQKAFSPSGSNGQQPVPPHGQ